MIIIRNPAHSRPLSQNVKRLMKESRASPYNPAVGKAGRTMADKDLAFCDSGLLCAGLRMMIMSVPPPLLHPPGLPSVSLRRSAPPAARPAGQ